MYQEIISCAIVLGTGAFGFLFRGYFGSYVAEKGKNLATKEDIAKITAQVESVKASVQTVAMLKNDYEQQRRQCLLSFYDSALDMLYEKLSVNFGDFPCDEGKSFFEFEQSFHQLTATMLKQYQRIVLYFEHEDSLRASAEVLLNKALEAYRLFKRGFTEVKFSLLEENNAFKAGGGESFAAAAEVSSRANRKYWDQMHPIAEGFQDAVRVYLTRVNQFLKNGSSFFPD